MKLISTAGTCVVIGALLSSSGAELLGQRPDRFWGEVVRTSIRSQSTFESASRPAGGYILGAEGGVGAGIFVLRAALASGRLDSRIEGVAGREQVEGHLLLGVEAVDGFEVALGPRARAITVDEQTQRWLSWVWQARYEADIFMQSLGAYVEYWDALAGSVSSASEFLKGRGGTIGIVGRLPETPIYARFEYSIDDSRAALPDAGPGFLNLGLLPAIISEGEHRRRETVQGLKFGLGIKW